VRVVELIGQLRQDAAEGLQLLEHGAAHTQAGRSEQLGELALQATERQQGAGADGAVDRDPEQVLVASFEGGPQSLGVLEGGVALGIAEAAGADQLGAAVARGLGQQEALGARAGDGLDLEAQSEGNVRGADREQLAGHDRAG